MTATGYAVVRGSKLLAAGVIKTSPRDPEPVRIGVILAHLLDLVREHDVDHMAVEEFTAFYTSSRYGTANARRGGKRKGKHDRDVVNPKSMFLMKAAQTAAQTAAIVAGVPLFLYPVDKWKGRGVSKEQTIQQAQLIYGVKTRNDNITDAIMIAHHHCNWGKLRPETGVVFEAEEKEILDRFVVRPKKREADAA